MAYVELAKDRTPTTELADEIVAYAREHIAAFKAPRKIVFLPELPRTETGKIRRAALRELAAKEPS
jgi:fatty-acyl-CoA synthase